MKTPVQFDDNTKSKVYRFHNKFTISINSHSMEISESFIALVPMGK